MLDHGLPLHCFCPISREKTSKNYYRLFTFDYFSTILVRRYRRDRQPPQREGFRAVFRQPAEQRCRKKKSARSPVKLRWTWKLPRRQSALLQKGGPFGR